MLTAFAAALTLSAALLLLCATRSGARQAGEDRGARIAEPNWPHCPPDRSRGLLPANFNEGRN